jgi:hypothetical protein
MSWAPSEPFSGFSLDFDAVGTAAEQLQTHAADAQTHGAKLTANTQRPVGSGYYGTIVNSAVGRMLSAVASGFTGALQGFYHDTARILEHNAGEMQKVETATKTSLDAIGNHSYQQPAGGLLAHVNHSLGSEDPFSGSAVDHIVDYHATQAQVVGPSTVGAINAKFKAAQKDRRLGGMFTNYDPYSGQGANEPVALNADWDQKAHDGHGGWKYPRHAGAVPGTEHPVNLKEGEVLSRFGHPKGTYFAPYGTPFEERGLPPTAIGSKEDGFGHHLYIVLKPLPATASTVAPAFGQKGGGTQIVTEHSAQWLVENGYLKEHHP